MKNVLFTAVFATILMVGTTLSAQSAISCQDMLIETVQNVVLVPVQAELAKKPVYIIIVFDKKKADEKLAGGGYKGYFFDTSMLKIDGKFSKPADLRKIFDVTTAKIHMLVPNGRCGWENKIGTFTSIEVMTRKK